MGWVGGGGRQGNRDGDGAALLLHGDADGEHLFQTQDLVVRRARDGEEVLALWPMGLPGGRPAPPLVERVDDQAHPPAPPDRFITGVSQPPRYQDLVTSPGGIRDRVVELIDAEAAAGPDGRIVLKVNGLDDVAVMDALYRASQAGVPIELIIRGICCLRPGVPGLSETIRVRSIVGRFLEHSRILRFGGAAGRPAVHYIGSADLRRRNLDRRVEAMIPVSDPESVDRLEEILACNLADDVQSWSLAADGSWSRIPTVLGNATQASLEEAALSRGDLLDTPRTPRA